MRLKTILVVTALLLTGCATANQPQTLKDFYTQDIKWRSCEDYFQCATYKVPIDYSKLSEGTFEISILKYEAGQAKNRLGSLVINPGGPGASGVDYAYEAASVLSDEISARYDIVGFDPRGVSRSAPIKCLNDEETDYQYASDGTPSNDGEYTQLVMDAKRYAQKCIDRTKHIASYTTANTARDMDILRAVLGDKKLNYLGKSYGTYLGTIYAELFPDNVGRFVLDGAIDPNMSAHEQNLIQAQGFDRALAAFITDCLTLKDCPLTGPQETATEEVIDLFNKVDTQPLTNKVGRKATQSLVVLGTAAALYDNTQGWPLLRTAFKEAKTGNGYMFLELSDMYTQRTAKGKYTGNEGDASMVIDCLDLPDRQSDQQLKAEADIFKEQAPIFGPYLAYGGITCRYLPKVKSEKITKISTTPIIIIGTLRDPATPYQWAQALNKVLTGSILITLDADGHTGHNRGSTCVDNAIDNFYLSGKLPQENLTCSLSAAL
jgi:pimeloyl-ACP methyl ester carboxylesterase